MEGARAAYGTSKWTGSMIDTVIQKIRTIVIGICDYLCYFWDHEGWPPVWLVLSQGVAIVLAWWAIIGFDKR